ncbi:Holliday junction resolvase RecU [Candidatus Phytoplasma ziziphi]|uniref:Holliday junction resolvase RecU n=1 Tax=Ziziphus jujuba witches'-broom phytoplasma TaxID=135727 RepID=A0A660HM41_ZIZJU|nr:Holliday junction resolvase RecU [Candidatus Phytoplasma ziziphi]AYJ01052.1 Holliday junction resolvase RecU [Candidatus Phytoplasma ziziphi]
MLKYPFQKKHINKSNLGMNLERDINLTNLFYQDKKIALIYKNAIPIQVVKVDYSSRQRAKIIEAYYHSKSLPDYQGIYRGRYLCFDVKETNNKTSFSLSNIPPHQIQKLQLIEQFHGIAFFIINFKAKNKYFYLPINFLNDYMQNSKMKSINYKIFEENLYQIPVSYSPRLNYLKIVDNFI